MHVQYTVGSPNLLSSMQVVHWSLRKKDSMWSVFELTPYLGKQAVTITLLSSGYIAALWSDLCPATSNISFVQQSLSETIP